MRRVWIALAREQARQGLVSKKVVEAMEAHIDEIDVDRITELEKSSKHDVIAAKEHFEEVAPEAKGKVHLGATSMDITDNAAVMVHLQALGVIKTRMVNVLSVLSEKMSEHQNTVINAYTHGQVAEPTTLGYRYASYAQDLLSAFSQLETLEASIKGKGLKGAVGTRASYTTLLGSNKKAREMEARVSKEIGLPTHDITTQTYPRSQDLAVADLLNTIAVPLARMNYDYLFTGSTPFNEYREGSAKGQKGSSAMPHKRNQTKVENIIGMTNIVAGFRDMIDRTVRFGALERTIHDSSARRIAVPQMFLALDEALNRTIHVLNNTEINKEVINKNLREYGVFSLSEPVLSKLSKTVDRSVAYDWLQEHAKSASAAIARGQPNDFVQRVLGDGRITEHIPEAELRKMLSIDALTHHVGDAPAQSEIMARRIRARLKPYTSIIGKTSKIEI
ncbi:MAG: lyase family protein [Candidatus Micrarchaeia archaeon]